MKIEQIEDIHVWQNARKLANEIYGAFKDIKDFEFKNQIQRAVISVMNNIAEGFERMSDNELKYYLYMAKGSAGEVRSMLYLAKDFEHIDEKKFKELLELTKLISGMLTNFIKSIKH